MLEQLINWLREEQLRAQQGVFDAPPKTMEELRDRLATERTFGDVLKKIEQLHRQEDDNEQRR